jgi:hypothetical protein
MLTPNTNVVFCVLSRPVSTSAYKKPGDGSPGFFENGTVGVPAVISAHLWNQSPNFFSPCMPEGEG